MRGFEINYEKAMRRFERLFEKSISSLSDLEENFKRSFRTLSVNGKRGDMMGEDISFARSNELMKSPNFDIRFGKQPILRAISEEHLV